MTPHSVVSVLGLHCLPVSLKKEARLIWFQNMTVGHASDSLITLV